jgi:hypothetical protein
LVLQQYESCAQISAAHAVQEPLSLTPVAQTACAQLAPPLEELDEDELEEPPPHDSPQMEATSPTQTLSHAVAQQ